jgi:hypothetical protein
VELLVEEHRSWAAEVEDIQKESRPEPCGERDGQIVLRVQIQ